ncbi:hypothetical protein LOZ57_001838 [Ophidiomyces ophidiicola]|uniref:uncharacterized protein n=1 Tax=Ophidiomyces ophidiicola TaxID=1387563 RepID=UPI0020C2D159|nr:uncharacterized protein LOZ57_001838 [Ophidiomyces ophidiicola]KAI1951283.1 hypothetical protein LOZ57_001838 [Ophidiomyces ophidiicola]KAI2060700.1 hypothetical protein LOZ43_001525 [Ophidiomyces ophidiicola]
MLRGLFIKPSNRSSTSSSSSRSDRHRHRDRDERSSTSSSRRKTKSRPEDDLSPATRKSTRSEEPERSRTTSSYPEYSENAARSAVSSSYVTAIDDDYDDYTRSKDKNDISDDDKAGEGPASPRSLRSEVRRQERRARAGEGELSGTREQRRWRKEDADEAAQIYDLEGRDYRPRRNDDEFGIDEEQELRNLERDPDSQETGYERRRSDRDRVVVSDRADRRRHRNEFDAEDPLAYLDERKYKQRRAKAEPVDEDMSFPYSSRSIPDIPRGYPTAYFAPETTPTNDISVPPNLSRAAATPAQRADNMSPSAAYGLAADYYNDQGQSVSTQPGVRPDSQPVIAGTQPHLMSPLETPAPPVEPSALGQPGAAESFYTTPTPQNNQPHNGSPASSTATYGIDPILLDENPAQEPPHTSSLPASHSQGQTDMSHQHHSKFSSAHAGMAALGVGAGLSAASALGQNTTQGMHYPSNQLYYPGKPGYQRKYHGPLGRFINFWRDPEAVAQYEEYSEIIGVCKYCFEPGTTSRDAPRKHHYRQKNFNNNFNGRSKVDKYSRYASSSDESRRRKRSGMKPWIGAGLAAAAGKSIYDITRSNASGNSSKRYARSASPTSSTSGYSANPGTRSYVSQGVTTVSSNSHPATSAVSGYGLPPAQYAYPHHPRSRERTRPGSSGSSSFSSEESRGVGRKGLALGAAAVGAGALASRARRRSRTKSPKKHPRRRRRSSSSSSGSLVDISRVSGKSGMAGLSYFFTAPSEKRIKDRPEGSKKKQRGFFSFRSASSSSSDDDLAFGPGFYKGPSRRSTKNKDDGNVDAKLLALGGTAVSLAGAAAYMDGRRRRRPDLVAVKERRHGYPSNAPMISTAGHKYDDDDGWESMSESSLDSALAYGGDSSDSGTSKWGWRWGKRRKQPKPVAKLGAPALAPALALIPAAAAIESSASQPSMHNVYPVSTSDPSRFETVTETQALEPSDRREREPLRLTSSEPLLQEGPEATGHPQPTYPQGQAAQPLTRRNDVDHPMTTTGPFSEPIDTYRNRREEFDDRHARDLRGDRGHRRRESSPAFSSTQFDTSDYRLPKRHSASQVQFNLTQEQEEKELRQELDDERRARRRERASRPPVDDSYRDWPEYEDDRSSKNGERETSSRYYRAIPVGAALVGAAATSAILSDLGDKQSRKLIDESQERNSSKRHDYSESDDDGRKSSRVPRRDFDSDDGDTDHARRIAVEATKRIIASPAYDSYVEYFTPEEFRSSKNHSRSDTSSDPSLKDPPKVRFDKEAAKISDGVDPSRLPWPVPHLNLIEPTPPHSTDGSVISDGYHENESPIEPVRDQSSTASDKTEDARDHKTTEGPQGITRDPIVGLAEVRGPENTDIPKEFQQESAMTRSTETPKAEMVKDDDSPIEEVVSQRIPGGFDDDIEFAATLAAGAVLAGFDPSIVTNEPMYHSRTSPPSSEPENVSVETAIFGELPDLSTTGSPSHIHGFVEPESLPSSDTEDFYGKKKSARNVDDRSSKIVPTKEKDDMSEELTHQVPEYLPAHKVASDTREFFDAQEEQAPKSLITEERGSQKFVPLIDDHSGEGLVSSDTFDNEAETGLKLKSQAPVEEPIQPEPETKTISSKKQKRKNKNKQVRSEVEADPVEPTEFSTQRREVDFQEPTDIKLDEKQSFVRGDLGPDSNLEAQKEDSLPEGENDEVVDVPGISTSKSKRKKRKQRRADVAPEQVQLPFGVHEGQLADCSETDHGTSLTEDHVIDSVGGDIRRRSPDEPVWDEVESSGRKRNRKERTKDRKSRYEEIVGSGKPTDDEVRFSVILTGQVLISRQTEASTTKSLPDSFLGERPEILSMGDSASGIDAETPAFVKAPTTPVTSTPPDTLLGQRGRSRSSSPFPGEKFDLPPLSRSRPSSPSPGMVTPRRISLRGDHDLSPSATPSPTAVPLHFRRPFSAHSASPTAPPAPESSGSSPATARAHKRPKSTEFKFDRELRPLWLVERHSYSKPEEQTEGPYPSLPSSRATSRSPSVEGQRASSEADFAYDQSAGIPRRQPIELRLDTNQMPENDDVLDSKEATPTAATYQDAMKKQKPKYEFHSPSELLMGHFDESLDSLPPLPESPKSASIPDEELPPLPDSIPESPATEAESWRTAGDRSSISVQSDVTAIPNFGHESFEADQPESRDLGSRPSTAFSAYESAVEYDALEATTPVPISPVSTSGIYVQKHLHDNLETSRGVEGPATIPFTVNDALNTTAPPADELFQEANDHIVDPVSAEEKQYQGVVGAVNTNEMGSVLPEYQGEDAMHSRDGDTSNFQDPASVAETISPEQETEEPTSILAHEPSPNIFPQKVKALQDPDNQLITSTDDHDGETSAKAAVIETEPILPDAVTEAPKNAPLQQTGVESKPTEPTAVEDPEKALISGEEMGIETSRQIGHISTPDPVFNSFFPQVADISIEEAFGPGLPDVVQRGPQSNEQNMPPETSISEVSIPFPLVKDRDVSPEAVASDDKPYESPVTFSIKPTKSKKGKRGKRKGRGSVATSGKDDAGLLEGDSDAPIAEAEEATVLAKQGQTPPFDGHIFTTHDVNNPLEFPTPSRKEAVEMNDPTLTAELSHKDENHPFTAITISPEDIASPEAAADQVDRSSQDFDRNTDTAEALTTSSVAEQPQLSSAKDFILESKEIAPTTSPTEEARETFKPSPVQDANTQGIFVEDGISGSEAVIEPLTALQKEEDNHSIVATEEAVTAHDAIEPLTTAISPIISHDISDGLQDKGNPTWEASTEHIANVEGNGQESPESLTVVTEESLKDDSQNNTALEPREIADDYFAPVTSRKDKKKKRKSKKFRVEDEPSTDANDKKELDCSTVEESTPPQEQPHSPSQSPQEAGTDVLAASDEALGKEEVDDMTTSRSLANEEHLEYFVPTENVEAEEEIAVATEEPLTDIFPLITKKAKKKRKEKALIVTPTPEDSQTLQKDMEQVDAEPSSETQETSPGGDGVGVDKDFPGDDAVDKLGSLSSPQKLLGEQQIVEIPDNEHVHTLDLSNTGVMDVPSEIPLVGEDASFPAAGSSMEANTPDSAPEALGQGTQLGEEETQTCRTSPDEITNQNDTEVFNDAPEFLPSVTANDATGPQMDPIDIDIDSSPFVRKKSKKGKGKKKRQEPEPRESDISVGKNKNKQEVCEEKIDMEQEPTQNPMESVTMGNDHELHGSLKDEQIPTPFRATISNTDEVVQDQGTVPETTKVVDDGTEPTTGTFIARPEIVFVPRDGAETGSIIASNPKDPMASTTPDETPQPAAVPAEDLEIRRMETDFSCGDNENGPPPVEGFTCLDEPTAKSSTEPVQLEAVMESPEGIVPVFETGGLETASLDTSTMDEIPTAIVEKDESLAEDFWDEQVTKKRKKGKGKRMEILPVDDKPLADTADVSQPMDLERNLPPSAIKDTEFRDIEMKESHSELTPDIHTPLANEPIPNSEDGIAVSESTKPSRKQSRKDKKKKKATMDVGPPEVESNVWMNLDKNALSESTLKLPEESTAQDTSSGSQHVILEGSSTDGIELSPSTILETVEPSASISPLDSDNKQPPLTEDKKATDNAALEPGIRETEVVAEPLISKVESEEHQDEPVAAWTSGGKKSKKDKKARKGKKVDTEPQKDEVQLSVVPQVDQQVENQFNEGDTERSVKEEPKSAKSKRKAKKDKKKQDFWEDEPPPLEKTTATEVAHAEHAEDTTVSPLRADESEPEEPNSSKTRRKAKKNKQKEAFNLTGSPPAVQNPVDRSDIETPYPPEPELHSDVDATTLEQSTTKPNEARSEEHLEEVVSREGVDDQSTIGGRETDGKEFQSFKKKSKNSKRNAKTTDWTDEIPTEQVIPEPADQGPPRPPATETSPEHAVPTPSIQQTDFPDVISKRDTHFDDELHGPVGPPGSTTVDNSDPPSGNQQPPPTADTITKSETLGDSSDGLGPATALTPIKNPFAQIISPDTTTTPIITKNNHCLPITLDALPESKPSTHSQEQDSVQHEVPPKGLDANHHTSENGSRLSIEPLIENWGSENRYSMQLEPHMASDCQVEFSGNEELDAKSEEDKAAPLETQSAMLESATLMQSDSVIRPVIEAPEKIEIASESCALKEMIVDKDSQEVDTPYQKTYPAQNEMTQSPESQSCDKQLEDEAASSQWASKKRKKNKKAKKGVLPLTRPTSPSVDPVRTDADMSNLCEAPVIILPEASTETVLRKEKRGRKGKGKKIDSGATEEDKVSSDDAIGPPEMMRLEKRVPEDKNTSDAIGVAILQAQLDTTAAKETTTDGPPAKGINYRLRGEGFSGPSSPILNDQSNAKDVGENTFEQGPARIESSRQIADVEKNLSAETPSSEALPLTSIEVLNPDLQRKVNQVAPKSDALKNEAVLGEIIEDDCEDSPVKTIEPSIKPFLLSEKKDDTPRDDDSLPSIDWDQSKQGAFHDYALKSTISLPDFQVPGGKVHGPRYSFESDQPHLLKSIEGGIEEFNADARPNSTLYDHSSGLPRLSRQSMELTPELDMRAQSNPSRQFSQPPSEGAQQQKQESWQTPIGIVASVFPHLARVSRKSNEKLNPETSEVIESKVINRQGDGQLQHREQSNAISQAQMGKDVVEQAPNLSPNSPLRGLSSDLRESVSTPQLQQPPSIFGGPYGLADQYRTRSPPKSPLAPIKEQATVGGLASSRQSYILDSSSLDQGSSVKLAQAPPAFAIRPIQDTPQATPRAQLRSFSGPPDNILKTPETSEIVRTGSVTSLDSLRSTDSLRLRRSRGSGDLRAQSNIDHLGGKNKYPTPQPEEEDVNIEAIASSSTYDPVTDKGKLPLRGMAADVYEGWGDIPGSPLSPSRPPSVRRRRSLQHLQDLETRLDQLVSENRLLSTAKSTSEKALEAQTIAQRQHAKALEAREQELQDKDSQIQQLKKTAQWLQTELNKLTELNEGLTASNAGLQQSREHQTSQHNEVAQQWQQSREELEDLRAKYTQLSAGMATIVSTEVDTALAEKNAEIRRLREELLESQEKIKELQEKIIASSHDNVITFRDEDYFEGACQKLCHHVQQWVLRFSKFSDMRLCRLTSTLRDEKVADRFENAILDGSDVDSYLADRVKRRDVFMSVVMTMMWDYIFTRYLFGMDREQRQKLKILEKQLSEVGPPAAVQRWRATTLSLLAKRHAFQDQRALDTEAVVQEIYRTLSKLLPPPQDLEQSIQDSLRKVMKSAVDLSVLMRTQKAEYIMLPPLRPEYDTNGELTRKVHFNADLMNERSGETVSNEELESQQAVVRIVLFPLVVKKGTDEGEGDEEIVVCPAQVLVARPARDKKMVRILSGDRLSANPANQSMQSISEMGTGTMI